jgi:Right handed beta helix region
MKLYRLGSAAAALILLAAPLAAQIAHTWVSPTGNDGSCTGSMASPCGTFQQAVNLTAAGGIVSVLGPGDYGPINISQSVTIDGTGGGSISFAGDGEGIYVAPTAAATVVLHNLTLDGGGTGDFGIYLSTSSPVNVNLTIDGCRVEGATTYGIGIGSTGPEYVVIRNTVVVGGQVGVRTIQGVPTTTVYDHVSLDHVTVQGATTAGVFTRNGNMDIGNSNISGNTGANVIGLEADTAATMNVQNSTVTNNTEGVCIYTNSTAVVSNTTVVDNATNFEVCGGTVEGAGGEGPAPKGGAAPARVPPDKPRSKKPGL